MEQIVNIGLIVSYILVILGGLSAIILPLINAMSNPKTLMYAGIGIVGLLVFFLIGYAIAGNEVTANYIKYGVDAGISKVVGGALICMYILTIIAIIGIVYTELSKVIR